ncbi:MAG: UvrD-helicase domain-containing protein [Candidatus Shapirobacteria bacterium]
MDILSDLNPNQRQAVTHQGSPLLILAGAGSGKTKVLTHRAAYFIQEKIAKPEEILLLTFTNKAAGEMKARMSKLIPSIQDLGTRNLFAGTFHSFSVSILRRYGPEIGLSRDFVIYDADDQENIIRTCLSDLNLTPKEFKPSSVLYFIESAKDQFMTPADSQAKAHGFWEEYAAKIYKGYQERLTKYRALDFSDLLFYTVKLLSENKEVLAKVNLKHTHILVDEYQDTNQIQYALTRLLASDSGEITAVGDAAQSIYGWRGADFRNLMRLKDDFPKTTIINLEQNYRSTQTILSAANAVIAKNTSHPVLSLKATKPDSRLIHVFSAASELDEASFVGNEINTLVMNYHLAFSDIAVLYRTNAQSRVIEEAFLKAEIPYVLVGGLRFYDRAEIKDLVAMLRFIFNPEDKLSEGRIEKALGKKLKTLFVSNLGNFSPKSKSIDVLESVLTNSGYLNKFDPSDEDDQRRLENIKELKSVATSFPKLADFLENIALVQQEYSLQEKNRSKEKRQGVRLMTLHSSKGLEFEAVFIVGLEEGILPHSRSLIDDDIEEERRLCYVGITRAKEFLCLTYATRRLFYGKSSLNEPSRFLHEIPTDLTELRESTQIIHDLRSQKPGSDSDFIYDPDIY